MTDRSVLQLHTAWASNTGGPYVTAWDEVIVPFNGTLRSADAGARALASNARQNSVDIYYQADAPSFGSNTATTVLVSPITLVNNQDVASGTIREAGRRVARGGRLQLRTDAGTAGSTQSFVELHASVVIERDPD